MNELIQLLQQRVGLNEQQSQAVVQFFANHLRSKLPESLQNTVMPMLGLQEEGKGTENNPAGLGNVIGSVEGMFGRKS